MNVPFPRPPFSSNPPKRPNTERTILCFSHLRWNFVHQRPQHLLTEASSTYRVYFIEEPEFAPGTPHFRMHVSEAGVVVLTPVLDPASDHLREMRALTESLHRSLRGSLLVHWFYTPMALRFARDLPCDQCVYDCMDELSAFRFAPPELMALERELLACSDLVFTGGQSLFAAKRSLHPDVHCFPSSVDVRHFGQARAPLADPADQAGVAHPRVGFAGVIDERIDLGLIASASAALPDVQFVMIGPTAKIDPASLPQAANIHWLGRKDYDALPAYMANWQAAWMPFALNEATRFISPTKTPEFLSAGLRVVSTAVVDVVAGYARGGLVTIADVGTIADDLRAVLSPPPSDWLRKVDRHLAMMSWSGTWQAMETLLQSRMHAAQEAAHV